MSKFLLRGGRALEGRIAVQGSKNSALPLIAATVLTDQACEIRNVPDIADVRNFLEILGFLGASWEFRNHHLRISNENLQSKPLPVHLVSKLRGSVLLLGPLLARFGEVQMSYPGGDAIGQRPIDVHLEGFRRLGAEIGESSDQVSVKVGKLIGEKIILSVTSVTGTENLVMAALGASGQTEIRLAATEPHVQDLCRFLIEMGAEIRGIGSPNLVIEKVSKLKGATYTVGPDDIEAVTFCAAAAASCGHVTVEGVELNNLDAPIALLERMKVNFRTDKGQIEILPPRVPYAGVRIVTGVFPQLLTDYQPLFGVLATQCQGETSIHDWIFEGRQGYLHALEAMGARVKFEDAHRAKIYGPCELQGTEIVTADIRAGASVLIAALVAKGESVIYNAEIIDRGYENFHERLRSLGAEIERVNS